MYKKIIAGLVGAVALLVGLPASSAQASTASCLTTVHARPTTSGWHPDPCAKYVITEYDQFNQPYTRLVSSVDFEWSMSGGAHITGTRATGRITDLNNEDDWVQITDTNLGRTNGYSGVLWSQSGAVRGTTDVLLSGGKVAGVGCGDYAHPIGAGSYGIQAHHWFTWLPYFSELPFNRDFLSGQSYYQFAGDGSCSA